MIPPHELSNLPDPSDPSDPSSLVHHLLQCPAEHRHAWITAHLSVPTLKTIEALKSISDTIIFIDPDVSNAATSHALLLAKQIPSEPLALPIASWARGTWETFHGNPRASIHWHESALPAIRTHGERLQVARLLGNMVSSYTDTASYTAADQAYEEARRIFLDEMQHPATYAQALDGLQMLEENYGWMLHERGWYEEALAVHTRALELAQQLGRMEFVVEVQNNRTMTLGMLGRMKEAEEQLRSLRRIAEAHHQAVTVARLDMNLGEIYRALGDPVNALSQFQVAERQFAALNSMVDLGTVWLFEARLFERIGALPAAIRNYSRAREQFRAREMKAYEGSALFWGAVANRRYGEYEQAISLLEESGVLWRETGNDEWCARVQIERVELALAWRDAPLSADALLQSLSPQDYIPELQSHCAIVQAAALVLAVETMASGEAERGEAEEEAGRKDGPRCAADLLAQAKHFCEQGLHTAREIHDRWLERYALVVFGRVLLAAGENEAAHCHLEAAVECDNRIRRMLSEEELKASFQMHNSDVFPLLVRFSATHHDPRQTLHTVWRAKGSALLDLLTETRARQMSSPEATETQETPALQASIQRDIARVRQQLASYRLQYEKEDKAPVRESLRQTIDELEQHLYTLRRQRLQGAVPEANADTTLDRATLDRATMLQPDYLAAWDGDVLIEYMRCDDDLLAIRYDRGGDCRVVWLDTASLNRQIRKLQRVLENVALYPDLRQQNHAAWLAECLPLLRRCYETLIAPLGPFSANARLLIAPCDPLHMVPFAALWDGQHYLVEHHEIEMTPCGALLLVHPTAAPTTPPLIIVNSDDGTFPENRAQGATLQQIFATSTCLIDDPTDYQRLSNLTAAPVVLHLAAHQIERGEGKSTMPAPIFTALQLAGGVFTVEQCFDLPLAGTELVTLGGCTTGGGLETGGSLLAFQSACFVAGARRVVASLWSVHERDAHLWMAHFYRYLHEHRQATGAWHPAAAVRQAQRALLRDPQTSHPAVWANFACSRR